MDKSPDAFRTISEVADLLETPAHVLRFWESRFPQVRPVKRAGGRRYYRPTDVALLAGIRLLLHDQGMTIRGVQKILREQGVRHVCSLVDARDLVAEAQAEWAGEDAVDLTVAAPAPAPDLPDDRVIAWRGPRPRDGSDDDAPSAFDPTVGEEPAHHVPEPQDAPGTAYETGSVGDIAGWDSARVEGLAPFDAAPEPQVTLHDTPAPDDALHADPATAPRDESAQPDAPSGAVLRDVTLTDPALAGDPFADMPLFRFAGEPPVGASPAGLLDGGEMDGGLPAAAATDAAPVASDDPTLDEGSVAIGQATRDLTGRLRALPPGRLDAGAVMPVVDGLRALRRQLDAAMSAALRH